MDPIGIILLAVGAVLFFIGGTWLVVVAFKESMAWGFGCLLVPFMDFIFLTKHWKEASKPFGVSLLGMLLISIAAFFMHA
jgi:hypothetical protein